MCPDGTQYRQVSPDAPDATTYGAWVQDAQGAQHFESRLGQSGHLSVSDACHLYAHVPWRTHNSIAESSTTTALITNLIARDRCARFQLHSGINDVSVVSDLMKSLPLVRVVFIYTLGIPELNGRFLHKCCADPGSD